MIFNAIIETKSQKYGKSIEIRKLFYSVKLLKLLDTHTYY